MNTKRFCTRFPAGAVLAILAVSCCEAEQPTAPKKRELHGELVEVNGVRVLRLWGTPREKGFAHGYLMADEVICLIREYMLPNVMETPGEYEHKILPAMTTKVNVSGNECAELAGLLDGLEAKLSKEALVIPELGRALTYQDLLAMNAYADYDGACSSFAAWGDRTESGKLIVARNLDYSMNDAAVSAQFIMVHTSPPGGSDKSTPPWWTVTWPGLIGAYTGANEEGVFVAMHNSNSLAQEHRQGFVLRSFALRRALVAIGPRDAVVWVARLLRTFPAVRGNNIMVCCPVRHARTCAPAAVLEYDGNRMKEGVTIRTGDTQFGENATAVLTTNHSRVRRQKTECNRYEKLLAALTSCGPGTITPESARTLIAAASVNTTVHTAIVVPEDRLLWIAIAEREGQNAARTEYHKLSFDELFRPHETADKRRLVPPTRPPQ